jgi:glyoxylase-like metal-dependent hydrolase (beta-lactamase superfamily II)
VLRRLLKIAGALVLLAFALVGALLGHAHWAIRGLGGPLPTDLSALDAADAPVRIAWINTSRQAMPRAQVLDPSRDPTPDRPYEMGHPAFVLGWADGRQLLVDVGMESDAALSFGRNIEPFGAAPAEAFGAAADRMPELASGLLGVVFTHLHVDHVQGIAALCARRGGAEVLVFSTPAQADRRNYTTQPAADLLAAAPCVRLVRLPEAPLAPLPGFPGVAVIWAAGHTPDAQVVLAAVARDGAPPQRIAFAGDVVNAVDGARFDVPKPFLYRWLVVPEDDARLGAVRRFLGHLEQAGFVLAPAHDLLHLRSLGLDEIGAAAGGAGG